MKILPLLACLMLTGCAGFRAAVRDLRNDDLVGSVAPSLDSGEWVGEEPDVEGDWYLVAFLKPW